MADKSALVPVDAIGNHKNTDLDVGIDDEKPSVSPANPSPANAAPPPPPPTNRRGQAVAVPSCRVCQKTEGIIGIFYGGKSCDACRIFFVRESKFLLQNQPERRCERNNICKIRWYNPRKTNCISCRLAKCRLIGMQYPNVPSDEDETVVEEEVKVEKNELDENEKEPADGKEAEDSRTANKRKKSIAEEVDVKEEKKKLRITSPLIKTDNAKRVPIRQSIQKEDIPTTITLSSDAISGIKNPRQSANTITNGSVVHDTKTVKSVAGISMMAEQFRRDAHAMFEDTVHLDAYYDTTMHHQEPTKVRSTSSDTEPNVNYDAEGETDNEEKEYLEVARGGLKESAEIDDYFKPQSFTNHTFLFETVVGGSHKPSAATLTSTPANVVPYVCVGEYFDVKKNIEEKEDNEKFEFPVVPSLLHRRMMQKKGFAAKGVMTTEVKNGEKTYGGCISEQFHRRLSLKADETATETDIKNIRRSEIINPWDEELRKNLMKMVNPASNMHEFQEICPKIQAMKEIEAGGERFKIQTLIGQGGYAKVYRATNEDSKVVAVKYEVPSCTWEAFVCDQMQIRLLRNKKKISKRIAEYCIMTVIDAFIFTNASLLVNEYHEYGTLLEYANNLKDPNWHLSCFLINQAAKIIQEVHEVGIIHGDIKPDNFIITRKIDANWTKDQLLTADCFVIKLIDWGRAIDMMTLKGRKFVGKAGKEGFFCPEMIDGRPWTFQTDYFGFAASVAVLTTGKYASLNGTSLGKYSLKTTIKWFDDFEDLVWQITDNFLNIRSCSELPGWNTTINALSETWASKFESIVWTQSVVKFNESCDAARK